MAYRCGQCNIVVPDQTVLRLRVVATRLKIYPRREYVNRPCPWIMYDEDEHRHDQGGTGWEIAREVPVCGTCARMDGAVGVQTVAEAGVAA